LQYVATTLQIEGLSGVRHVPMHMWIQLLHVLKFLRMFTCQYHCHVRCTCLCRCFIGKKKKLKRLLY